MADNRFAVGVVPLLFLSYLLSLTFATPPFVRNLTDFKFLKGTLKIRYDSYFLVNRLNTPENYAVIFFDDATKKIYFVYNNELVQINKKFLKKEDNNFIYLFRDTYYDGKYVYTYASIKYGTPKYVVLFRTDTKTLETKYILIKQPSQALNVKLHADGKGRVFVVWMDEEKHPKRIVWAFSENFLKNFDGPFVVLEEEIIFFHPYIKNRNPWLIFIQDNILKIRNLRSGETLELYKFNNPREVKVDIGDKYIWMFVADGLLNLRILVISKDDFSLKKDLKIDTISIKGKKGKLKDYLWSVSDCKAYREKATCAIVAKPKTMPGVKLNGLTLPDKYNVFVLRDNEFNWINQPIPFLISYSSPVVAISDNKAITAYFGRKFIYGNTFVGVLNKETQTDIALEPPNTETGLPKLLKLSSTLYRILYPIRQDLSTHLRLVDIDIKNIKPYYTFPPKDVLYKKLQQRIKEFLKCQVEDNIQCIRKFMDPISREAFKRARHINIDVLDYKYTNVKIFEDTPFAVAEGIIKHRIPKGAFPGIDKDIIQEIKTHDLWVYMNDNWFFVPPAPMVGYFLKW